jgi:hypothetical protein
MNKIKVIIQNITRKKPFMSGFITTALLILFPMLINMIVAFYTPASIVFIIFGAILGVISTFIFATILYLGLSI